MTNKEFEVKEYLSRAISINKIIKSYELALEDASAKVSRSSSVVVFRKIKGARSNSQENRLIKYCDYAIYVEKKISYYEKEKQKINEVIEKLDDNKLKSLLLLRYINGMDWDKVAKIMEHDKRYVFKLHLKAIRTIISNNLIS